MLSRASLIVTTPAVRWYPKISGSSSVHEIGEVCDEPHKHFVLALLRDHASGSELDQDVRERRNILVFEADMLEARVSKVLGERAEVSVYRFAEQAARLDALYPVDHVNDLVGRSGEALPEQPAEVLGEALGTCVARVESEEHSGEG